MTDVELAGSDAHVYARGKAGHRPDHTCPCGPATPLVSTGSHGPRTALPAYGPPSSAGLYVHRPLGGRR